MPISSRSIPAILLNFVAGLRFRTLFLLVGALFFLDVLIPDFIPFTDELLLGCITLLLGSLKKKKDKGGAQ
jgi:hypothetical protein